MNTMLQGKVAIVTGAGRRNGIGFAAARALAGYGADVVVSDVTGRRTDLSIPSIHEVGIQLAELERRAEEVRSMGIRALACPLDITDAASVADCVARVDRELGGVDILFNNAGVPAGAGPFLDIPESAWSIQFDVCIKGVARFCRAVIPSMRERGGGAIINNSSIWGSEPLAGAGAYVAAKAGMIGLTKAIAVEHGPDNIRCNAILPGTVVTEINDSRVAMVCEKEGISIDEVRERMAAATSLKRLGRPEEIGALVAFLASDAAGFITGAAIPIDGGVQNGL